jgi:V/A-type H+-transporting ATPase subunit I
MKQIGRLTMFCGGAAMVVGFIMGGLFGTSLAGWKIFEPIKNIFIDSNSMFYVAVGVGIFQVMFAMVLNIVMTSRSFGIKYALATIGWFVVLATCICAFGLQTLGVNGFGEGEAFAPWGTAFYVCVGVGLFLMLFFNSPGKNPLVNFGAGLWATFNRLTGLLGDALSYIRLFAIGLSGGILAQVFNTIAVEISPDVPVLGQVVTLIILLAGHSLNLFLSTLSAIVHPLRLTFVEFFNNAGFEATERTFKPLKRSVNEHK